MVRRGLIAAILLLVGTAVLAQEYIVPFRRAAAGGGGSPPSVGSGNGGVISSGAVTSGTVNLPASISSGDILLTFAVLGSGGASAYDQGTAAEYTEATVTANASVDMGYAWKVANGSEGASAAAAWTGSSNHTFSTYRITGTTASTVTCGTAVNGNSGSPDPPSVSFTAPALIVTAITVDSNVVSISSDPSGYASCQTSTRNVSSGGIVRLCACEASSGSDCSSGDPGTWGLSAAEDYVSQTCAIEDN